MPVLNNLASALQQTDTELHLMYASGSPTSTSAPKKLGRVPKRSTQYLNAAQIASFAPPVRQQPQEALNAHFVAFQPPSVKQGPCF